MTKHTPGPWIMEGKRSLVGGDEFWCGEVSQPGTTYRGPVCMIQSCDHIGGITMAEAEANARLISAAPDLLAALKTLLEAVTAKGVGSIEILEACNAIAKATGEA